jgi:transcriptional regulator with XRE-family HTH domain
MDARATLGEARIRAELSQLALSERAGVSRATVSRIESGAVVPRVDTLEKLLVACGWELTGGPRPGTGVDRTAT